MISTNEKVYKGEALMSYGFMASILKKHLNTAKNTEFEKEMRSAATKTYKKAIEEDTFVSTVQSKFDRFIERLTTEDIKVVSLLLSRKGKELLSHCLENPNKLKIKSADGFTVADTIVSYAPTDVVKLLLDSAKTNDTIKKLIAKTHELEGGIEIETFALAIATLRERNEDDTRYTELAKEIKLLSRITD